MGRTKHAQRVAKEEVVAMTIGCKAVTMDRVKERRRDDDEERGESGKPVGGPALAECEEDAQTRPLDRPTTPRSVHSAPQRDKTRRHTDTPS